MSPRFHNELPQDLAAAVDALGAPPKAAQEQGAQQRLLARLRDAKAPRVAPVRWWATAAAGVLAMVVLAAVPMLSDRGSAFANVQAHFRNFETLSMHVEQRAGGRVLQTSRMLVDQQGRMRTDVGDMLSVIVDPVRGRVLMLQHGPRAAMSFPIDVAEQPQDAELDWLEEIRDFQGQARRLEETRVVDGQVAHGWALEAGGMPMVLWVNEEDLPLVLETEGGDGLSVSYRFDFDVAIPTGYLSSDIPNGYQMVERDGH